MRKDVPEGVILHIMSGTKPNFAVLARQFECDYRTVKRYYDLGLERKLDKLKQRRRPKSTLLDDYKEIIKEKLALGCTAMSIYYLISKKGYSGSYTTVKRYCRKERESSIQKATIRIETSPGLSAQVDWKESVRMVNNTGEVFFINIFLYVLGYSRMKYLQVTVDKQQKTLFDCLHQAFLYTGGVPEEIWFDNMRTVVDQSKTQFTRVVFNEKFRSFSKDSGFNPIACRPFRPQTKGKVEALARTMDRLNVFNHEFEDFTQLDQIVNEFNYDLNFEEISQGTMERPVDRWTKEKMSLKKLNSEILFPYSEEQQDKRLVSKESMIVYDYHKYSVPVKYIGNRVTVFVNENILKIYDGETLIREHLIKGKAFNYHRDDYVEILRSDVFAHLEEDELEQFVDENLKAYDYL
ncbi:MAG: IS21 family transposase [Fusobacteriales bacterium]|jgi:transposase|nr:IS21 family transposase [Fusobacteriales bacterium]